MGGGYVTLMIEGTWSGYGSGSGFVCHREYRRATPNQAAAIRGIAKTKAHRFSDDTWLYLSVTDVTGVHHAKREPKKLGYSEVVGAMLRGAGR